MQPLPLRARLADTNPLLGAWTVLREPIAAEMASRIGFDYVCIDGQHGFHDYRSISDQLAAIAAGGPALPVVRVLSNDPGQIGQVLDAGAMGVIVPMVNTAEQAQRVVSACFYAPKGERSYGPVGAGNRYGSDYRTTANDSIAPIPMIETVEALDNVEAIAATPGVVALYVGPSDLSLSLGLDPAIDHDEPIFEAALRRIASACRSAGIVAGVHADAPLVRKRKEQGFQMITIGYDLTPMTAGMRQALSTGRQS